MNIASRRPIIYTVDYLDGYQYESGKLLFFPTAEGYVKYTVGVQNPFDYVFNYTDHLGNIRLSYGINPATGLLKKLEENNYYPFGLKHGSYNIEEIIIAPRPIGGPVAVAGKMGKFMMQKEPPVIAGELDLPTQEPTLVPDFYSGYNYKYNGKELQDELGLDVYDYQARVYDPAAPHFWQIDPLAEKRGWLSPYNYVQNNPISKIDPDGMLDGDYYGRDGEYLGNDGIDDGKVYLLNDGVKKTNKADVNWGGTLSKADAKSVKSNSQEVGGLIIINRTEEGKDFTIGELSTSDKSVSGYTVEPGGPATTESGKDKRIPEGVYDLTPHTSTKYPGSYKVSNNEVSKDRAILIHAGNTGANTEGCILPGTNKTPTGVSASKPKLKEVYNFINQNSNKLPVKLIINEKIK